MIEIKFRPDIRFRDYSIHRSRGFRLRESLLSVGDLTIISNNGFLATSAAKNYDNEESYMYDMSVPLHGTFIHFRLKLDERMEPVVLTSDLLF